MIKSYISGFLAAIFLLTSLSVSGAETIDDYPKETEELWRSGSGAEDGAFNALSVSMFGWGLGLAAGIGLLAAILHQSKAETAHAHDSCD